MNLEKTNKKKIIIISIALTLLVELIIWIILGIVVYINYEKFSTAKSWMSEWVIKKEIKTIDLDENDLDLKENSKYYKWNFGIIEIQSDLKNNSFSESFNLKIDVNKISKEIAIKYLESENLLDKHIYNSLKNSDNIEKEISDIISLHSLLLNIKKDKWETIIDKINENIEKTQKNLKILIKTKNYNELSSYLKKLEKELNYNPNLFPENIFENNLMINNPNFQYIISKLYEDKTYKIIEDISNKTKIDKKLIMASIWVEQLRFLSTDRWFAKEMIKQNFPLINFNKFSYWVWWIKFETYQKINTWLKEYNQKMYEKYFEEYDLKSKIENDWKLVYSDPKIKEVLEDEYSWILYTAWLLHNILKKWEKEWYPIDDNIWVIITLYNMWNTKTPHASPDVWGSSIFIDSEHTYYFWELWFILYSYMKYYL